MFKIFNRNKNNNNTTPNNDDIINYRNFILVGGLLILGSIIAFKRLSWAAHYNIHIEELAIIFP